MLVNVDRDALVNILARLEERIEKVVELAKVEFELISSLPRYGLGPQHYGPYFEEVKAMNKLLRETKAVLQSEAFETFSLTAEDIAVVNSLDNPLEELESYRNRLRKTIGEIKRSESQTLQREREDFKTANDKRSKEYKKTDKNIFVYTVLGVTLLGFLINLLSQ